MHNMKLQSEYFDAIKYGNKIYEIRLNDEKRKQIKVGDFIEFIKEPLKEEKIILQVKDLIYFNDFNELLNNIDIKYLAPSNKNKDDLLNSLNKFYSLEEQKEYGVVAILLSKPNIIEKDSLSNISIDEEIFMSIKKEYKDFDI